MRAPRRNPFWKFAFILVVGSPLGSRASEQLSNSPVPNGQVHSIVADPARDQFIIGGTFDRLGPYTGGFAGVDKVTAAWVTPAFPKVNGTVHAMVDDGAGGFYIGGSFSQVGGFRRLNLARVLANGSVDPNWNPGTNGLVRTMISVPPLLYIGGGFSQVAGQTRNGVAAVALTTGEPASWNPNVTLDNTGDFARRFLGVTQLAALGSRIYIAGSFNAIGGVPRGGLGAVALATGAVDPWAPEPTGPLADGAEAVVADAANSRILVGGPFSNISSTSRNGVAALNPTSGAVLSWNPDVSVGSGASVGTIVVSGSSVYLGGTFSTVGGQTRPRLAEVNATTGAVTSWNPSPGNVSNLAITAIAREGSRVFVGGDFQLIGGQTRRHLAVVDATTGLPEPWDPLLGQNAPVFAISIQSDKIVAGGSFQTMGGTSRNSLAALDATTGALRPWNPETDGNVLAADIDGDIVYVGGSFTEVNGTARSNLAALDATTGSLLPWNPNSTNQMNLIDASGTHVLVGFGFKPSFSYTVGGASRAHLASIDKTSALATPFNPVPSSGVITEVFDMLPTGDRVFLSGRFTSVNGQSRVNLAATDAATGGTLGLVADTDSSGIVLDTELVGGALFVAGVFDTVSGQPRLSAAAIDPGSGALLDWNPAIDGIARKIAVDGPDLVIAGQNFDLGGEFLDALIRVNRVTGFVQPLGIPAKASNANVDRLALFGNRIAFSGLQSSSVSSLGDGRIFQIHSLRDRAVLQVNGRKRIVTSRAVAVVRGTSANSDRVEFKLGRERFKPAKEKGDQWSIRVRLSPGSNVLLIRATGPGGNSRPQKIVILRS